MDQGTSETNETTKPGYWNEAQQRERASIYLTLIRLAEDKDIMEPVYGTFTLSKAWKRFQTYLKNYHDRLSYINFYIDNLVLYIREAVSRNMSLTERVYGIIRFSIQYNDIPTHRCFLHDRLIESFPRVIETRYYKYLEKMAIKVESKDGGKTVQLVISTEGKAPTIVRLDNESRNLIMQDFSSHPSSQPHSSSPSSPSSPSHLSLSPHPHILQNILRFIALRTFGLHERIEMYLTLAYEDLLSSDRETVSLNLIPDTVFPCMDIYLHTAIHAALCVMDDDTLAKFKQDLIDEFNIKYFEQP